MATMYDSTNAALIPVDATLMAGYVNGHWPSYGPMCVRFPAAKVVSITVFSNGSADVLDVEQGDATPAQAPPWVQRERAKGHSPTIYCSRVSAWPQVRTAFKAAGVTEPDYWIADYTGVAHLVPGSVATQWTDVGPYDVSETNGTWPFHAAPIPPKELDMQLYVTNSTGTGFIVAADLSSKTAVVTGADAGELLATGMYYDVPQGKLSDAQINAIPNA